MTTKAILFLLPIFFCVSCSVYKSQGRKSFETDTPARVPIALIFYCRDSKEPTKSTKTASWNELKSIPSLVIKETIYNDTVVLLASSTQPDLICLSESLDLTEFKQKREILLSQINTWP